MIFFIAYLTSLVYRVRGGYGLFLVIGGKENSIGPDTAAKNALPLGILESFHITLKRIDRHLVQNAGDTLLDFAGKVANISLGFFGKFTDPGHALLGSTAGSFPLSIV